MKRKLNFKANSSKWKREAGGLVEYGLGGWLKDNMQGIMGGLKTVGGAMLLSNPFTAAAGVGLMGSGVSDIGNEIGGDMNAKNQEAALHQQKLAMIRGNQQSGVASSVNLPTFPGGGVVDKTARQTVAAKTQNPEWKDYYPNFPKADMLTDVTGRYTRRWKGTFDNAVRDLSYPEPMVELRDKNKRLYSVTVDDFYNVYNPDRSQKLYFHRQGGTIPNGMANAELEKEEVTLGPDGSMNKFNLPSHENATAENEVALQPGTRVFSDKLKPVGSNKTYADLADQIRKEIEKYESILNS